MKTAKVLRSPKEAKLQVKETLQLNHWGVLKREKWQGKLLKVRMEDESLNSKGCFAWLKESTACPIHSGEYARAIRTAVTDQGLRMQEDTDFHVG